MKTKLLALFVFIGSHLFSQTNFRFADSTAQWNVLNHMYGWFPITPDHYYTYIYKAEGDTVINGNQYQNISGTFLRRDSVDRIYEKKYGDSTEFMVYDFGASGGDTIQHLSMQYFITDITCIVDSADMVSINGSRKRMYVSCNSNLGWYQDVWIDGIGSLYNNAIIGGSEALIVDGPEESLLCFFENGQLLYHDTLYDTCSYFSPVGISEVEQISVSLSPNPASSFVVVQTENELPEQSRFQLFDIAGRLILQKQLSGTATSILLYGAERGIYSYRIIANNNKIAFGKLAVQ